MTPAMTPESPDHHASVLVVDDNLAIVQLLDEYLSTQGFAVDTAHTVRAMWQRLTERPPAAILLDVRLPDGDGLDLLPELRDRSRAAILILTVEAEPRQRVHGLDHGADDYIAKPFHLPEIGSRLRAVLRRMAPAPATLPAGATFGGWRLDRQHAVLVGVDGGRVPLTASEQRLWQTLAATADVPVDRDTLSAAVRHVAWEPEVRAIDVMVARLRARIEVAPRQPSVIVTVRNRGYMLVQRPSL